MKKNVFLLLLSVLFVQGVFSQNLVKNGDFELGLTPISPYNDPSNQNSFTHNVTDWTTGCEKNFAAVPYGGTPDLMDINAPACFNQIPFNNNTDNTNVHHLGTKRYVHLQRGGTFYDVNNELVFENESIIGKFNQALSPGNYNISFALSKCVKANNCTSPVDFSKSNPIQIEVLLEKSSDLCGNLTSVIYTSPMINTVGTWVVSTGTFSINSAQTGYDRVLFRIKTGGTMESGGVFIDDIIVAPKVVFGNYNQTSCNGAYYQICAPVSPAGASYTYSWIRSGASFELSNSQCYTPTVPDTYTLSVTDQFGFVSTTTFTIVAISVSSSFSTSSSPNGTNLVYTSTPATSNANNTWTLVQVTDATGATAVAGGANQSLNTFGNAPAIFSSTGVPSGLYYYKITHTGHYSKICYSTTSWVYLANPLNGKSLNVTNGSNDENRFIIENQMIDLNSISISPNPSTGKFNLGLNDLNAEKVVVYNMQGKVVNETTVERGQSSVDVDLSEYPSGVYMVHVNANGQIITKKVIKE